MKKIYFQISNILLGSFITMLGLGGCKSARHTDSIETVYGPPPGFEKEMLNDSTEQQTTPQPKLVIKEERKPDVIKVVYGPPPSKRSEKLLVPDNQGVYDLVEQMPAFPGGMTALKAWLDEQQRPVGQGGRVIVSFIVETDGSLNAFAVSKSVSQAADAEALRLLKAMPKWQPGRQGGDPVRVRYMLPLDIRTKE